MDNRVHGGTTAEEPLLGEWVNSEERDLADAARQRMQEAERVTRGGTTEAKEYVQDAVQRTKEYLAEARGHVQDSAQQARDKMSEFRAGGIEKLKDDIVGYTRKQPMTALLIAVGAGLVLGWLSAEGRR